MTKADIIEGVYEKVGFSKKESAEIVELVFDTLKETLERGDKIKISGFGNFQVRQKKARVGRNPQTGKEIEISARRVLTFRPSQVLKSALNGEAPPENHAEIDARDEDSDENDEFESDEFESDEGSDGKS
ncbi:MAG TPA: integration host factor subunit alpha [Myxococcaceae bacterium]|jgi:integration host factor subunit alpha|nr:integration host factor subunit alpha [Myxococcaceae bacterium]